MKLTEKQAAAQAVLAAEFQRLGITGSARENGRGARDTTTRRDPPGALPAAQALHQEHGAFTWVQVAERAQVGYSFARETVKNMACAGELQRVGRTNRPARASG